MLYASTFTVIFQDDLYADRTSPQPRPLSVELLLAVKFLGLVIRIPINSLHRGNSKYYHKGGNSC